MESKNDIIGKFHARVVKSKLEGLTVRTFKVVELEKWAFLSYSGGKGRHEFSENCLESTEFFDSEADARTHGENLKAYALEGR